MNIPSFLTISKRISLYALVVLTMAFAASAQKDRPAIEQPPNLDQCENGKFNVPQATTTKACDWVNGNLNGNNSHWVEGDFVPYRMVITDATTTIIVGYDTTEGGRHTFDYLGTYNNSVAKTLGIDPCIGITPCVASPDNTADNIDLDTLAQAGPDGILGNSDDITIPAGSFRIWNGTITDVTFLGYTGTFAGTSQASYSITFTHANATDPVVIAWSGHISTRADWTNGLSAIAINGSSYHMRNLTTGNQDRSLKIEAQTFPAKVTIIKQIGDTAALTSDLFFGFDRSDVAGSPDFFLQDTYTTAADPSDPTRTDAIVIDYPLEAGQTLSVNIQELAIGFGWSVSGLTCVDSDGGIGFNANSVPQAGAWDGVSTTATVNLQTSELVTCTFENLRDTSTAAPASVGGRVINNLGRGLSGVTMSLTDLHTGEVKIATTNAFGYYLFQNVDTEAFYSLTATSKRYMFPVDTQYFTLSGDNFDLNFVSR